MKKILSLILALMLLCGAAFAEEAGLSSYDGYSLAENEAVQIDLNGDGIQEELIVRLEGFEEEECLNIYVTDANGGVYKYGTYLRYSTALLVDDLDGNGMMEILVSGDEYSDDYITFCLNFDNETGFTPLMFADANRGDNTDQYFEFGYGKIKEISGTELTLLGSQDVLGTWMASRVFTLKNGRFELEDGGMWFMEEITEDSGIWDYFCLNPVKDLPVVFDDGSEGVLAAGEQFVVTQSDKTSVVHFETRSGKTGSFEIEPDVENGWGSLINGVNEEEWFEYVPYAD